MMRIKTISTILAVLSLTTMCRGADDDGNLGFTDTPFLPNSPWRVHDRSRPQPPVVEPGKTCGQPPSDAVILFDGKELSQWEDKDGKTPTGGLEDGCINILKAGDLYSKPKFGDCQLHIEWATPVTCDTAKHHWWGNSGVFFPRHVRIPDHRIARLCPQGRRTIRRHLRPDASPGQRGTTTGPVAGVRRDLRCTPIRRREGGHAGVLHSLLERRAGSISHRLHGQYPLQNRAQIQLLRHGRLDQAANSTAPPSGSATSGCAPFSSTPPSPPLRLLRPATQAARTQARRELGSRVDSSGNQKLRPGRCWSQMMQYVGPLSGAMLAST